MATTGNTGTSTPKRTTRKRAATRSRSTTARAKATRSATPRARALTDEARAAVKSVRTRATRAVKKVPTDRTSLSIAAGVLAGIVAAGVAIFMNRDRLRTAAQQGGEKIRQAADDLSSLAHDRIDQARDNITKFRARHNGSGVNQTQSTPDQISAVG